jgi:hypothetical protein
MFYCKNNPMKNLLLCLLTMLLVNLLSSCSVKSLPPSVIAELDEVERAMFEATTAGDSAAFRKICGADYITINGNGESHNLTETIPHVPRFKGVVDQLSNQTQRIYGNFAIRNGHLKAFMSGKLLGEIEYTSGWVYRDRRWQFVHWQGTLTGASLDASSATMKEPPSPDVPCQPWVECAHRN